MASVNNLGKTMTVMTTTNHTEACESILREMKAYNLERSIWPSMNAVADCLLARRIELVDAYAELHAKLGSYPPALKVFMDLVLGAAAFWNPESNAQARAKRERLEAVNKEIAEKAAALANLLDKRDELHNGSGFSSGTHNHPLELVEAASAENYFHQMHVAEPLTALRGRFDFKYWPSISDCLRALSHNAEDADVRASDRVTEAATRATRSSLADFFKALLVAIDENGAQNHGLLPRRFRLTDASLASLANCALDLGPDEIVDAAYVKRLRQRERGRAAD